MMEINPVLLESIFTEELFDVTPSPAIIIDQSWETITSPEKILLEKILAAIRLPLQSVTIIHQASLDLSHWPAKPRHVIYFGKAVKGIPLYEAVEADGVSLLASEGLDHLAKDEDARKKLWQGLKKQFSI